MPFAPDALDRKAAVTSIEVGSDIGATVAAALANEAGLEIR